MSKRKTVLEHMKVAGANNDRHAWSRLYVENRVSREVAERQWQTGRASVSIDSWEAPGEDPPHRAR